MAALAVLMDQPRKAEARYLTKMLRAERERAREERWLMAQMLPKPSDLEEEVEEKPHDSEPASALGVGAGTHGIARNAAGEPIRRVVTPTETEIGQEKEAGAKQQGQHQKEQGQEAAEPHGQEQEQEQEARVEPEQDLDRHQEQQLQEEGQQPDAGRRQWSTSQTNSRPASPQTSESESLDADSGHEEEDHPSADSTPPASPQTSESDASEEEEEGK